MSNEHPLHDTPLCSQSFAVVDVETTGLDTQRDRILELAVVHVTPGHLPELVLDTLVNPGRKVAWTELHGITDWDVEHAPTFDQLAETLHSVLAERVVVAHNAEFDLPIIGASLTRGGRLLGVPPHLCTLRLARTFCATTPSRALGPLCEALGLEHPDPHRARGDALATAQLLGRFLVAMDSIGLRCIADLQRFAASHDANFPFVRSFEAAPWPGSADPPTRVSLRPRSGGGPTRRGHLGLRRYRDEVLGVVHDLEVTDDELARVRRLRDDLGLSTGQVHAMHARVFHEYLSRFLDDDAIDPGESDALARLARCLRALGWAPGDPSS